MTFPGLVDGIQNLHIFVFIFQNQNPFYSDIISTLSCMVKGRVKRALSIGGVESIVKLTSYIDLQ